MTMLFISLEHELVYIAIRVDHAQDGSLRDLLQQRLDWSAVNQVAARHHPIYGMNGKNKCLI
jgi:hypothetical protein